jgi:hypothetical protein
MHPDDEIRAIVIVTIRITLDSLLIVFSSYRKVAIDDN